MVLNNKIRNSGDSGFTIVELLVVIVVIAILAAITIVSYLGITGKANSSAAKSNASSIISKISTYQNDSSTNVFPATLTAATSATATSAALQGLTIENVQIPPVSAGMIADATHTPTQTNFSYQICGITNVTTGTQGSPAAAPTAASQNISRITGIIVGYWDFSNTAQATLTNGTTMGTNITIAGTTYHNYIGCYYVYS